MAVPYAFVTLLTSDSYLPGALTLAAALKDVHPVPPVAPEVDFHTVCLVTPETVDVSSIKLLRRAFNVVIGVEIIEHDNQRGLQLLGRPDLTTVLTKLHVFRLTQYKKVVFLDADVLPTRPLSHLFSLDHEFAAVPDVGWPDIFNSGMMALAPNEAHFAELLRLAESQGSWDGGDQGLLNEWRGDDWHRLSFTYNTTPTAVYTYAPAYERFGKKISAIHFIGPNKPWVHLPWRAPGSTEAQSQANEPLEVYDYSALVDRWYAVYDKHYRSAPISSASEYASRRYESAWDQETSLGAEMPATTVPGEASKPLGLDDLRRMAIEGFSGPSYAQSGEGAYLRLPLDGRLDLMRPRPIQTTTSFESDPGPTTPLVDDHFFENGADTSTAWLPQQPPSGHPASAHGYAVARGQPYDIAQGAPFGYTAGVAHDFPWSSDSHSETEAPSPHLFRHIPHAGGHAHFTSQQQKQSDQRPPHARRLSFSSQQTYHQDQSSASEYEHGRPAAPPESVQGHRYGQNHEPPPPTGYDRPPPIHERPTSPPKMLWNPALEPPPNTAPISNFPPETYFPNVWDQSSRDQPYPSPRLGHLFAPPSPSALFKEPPPAQIPQRLLEEKHYARVVGDVSTTSPSPNPSRVKAIFPWEEAPRHMPARVFPDAGAASSGPFIKQQQQGPSGSPFTTPSPPAGAEAYLTPQQRPPSLSPPERALTSSSFGYMNAWDTVPSIQKYASRLVRSPDPRPLQPAFDLPESSRRAHRRAYRAYDSGNTSAEGDDEETDDEERDPVEREHDLRRRSRTGSVSNKPGPAAAASGKKEYRSQGVQTIRVEMRDAAAQVAMLSVPGLDADDSEKGPPTVTRPTAGMRSRQVSFNAQVQAQGQGATLAQSGAESHSPLGGARTGGRDSPAPGSGSASPTATHPRVRQAQVADSFIGQTARASPAGSPTGSRSPRLMRSPPGSSVDVARAAAGPTPRRAPAPVLSPPPAPTSAANSKALATPSPRVRPPTMTRSMSLTSDTLSTPSTLGPPRSPEDEFTPLPPPHAQARRSSRVWDPSRGVEIFKKGSEEVLARFLRMGSWEDEARRNAS